MPEGTRYKALKSEAEVVDGNVRDLLWDLTVYKHALQRVVDALWDLDKIPSRAQVHQLFYPVLRSYGFRAHVARNIYDATLALVRSARERNGSKPTRRRMTARLDRQDARVDIDNGVVRIAIREKWYTLRLKHRREYIDRFRGLRWKEVRVKHDGGRLLVSIVFEVRYAPYVPRGIVALDVNFRQVVAYDGCSVRRYETRFTDALSKRARAEEIQQKHGRRWRFNTRILDRIRSLYRRAKNIVIDWCRKIAKEIVVKARKRRYAIALEDLMHLRERSLAKNGSRAVWKLMMFAYRRLHESLVGKAIEYGVPIILVDPRDTSRTCPRCGNTLSYVYRLALCGCGLVTDRDVVDAMNILLRSVHAHVRAPGSLPNAPAVKDEARRSGGTKMSR